MASNLDNQKPSVRRRRTGRIAVARGVSVFVIGAVLTFHVLGAVLAWEDRSRLVLALVLTVGYLVGIVLWVAAAWHDDEYQRSRMLLPCAVGLAGALVGVIWISLVALLGGSLPSALAFPAILGQAGLVLTQLAQDRKDARAA